MRLIEDRSWRVSLHRTRVGRAICPEAGIIASFERASQRLLELVALLAEANKKMI
jgi:hypothetical protein